MEGKTMDGIYPFLVRRWIFGLPAPIWLKNMDMIGNTIEEYKLKPIPAESLMAEAPFASRDIAGGEQTSSKAPLRPWQWPGGIKIAHLHYKGDIYLLNEGQWKRFSTSIVNEFQKKLAGVKTIGFEQVMELSEGIDSIVV